MTDLRYSPLHVTELCGEMQGKFIVGRARLKNSPVLEKVHKVLMQMAQSGWLSYRTLATSYILVCNLQLVI